MLQRTNTMMPQTHTQNSEENDVALALIRFRSESNGSPIIQSPVKEVPFNPQQNRRRGTFTLCGRKPIANYPYQGPTKNGKPHTEKNEKGVEFLKLTAICSCTLDPTAKGIPMAMVCYIAIWTTIGPPI